MTQTIAAGGLTFVCDDAIEVSRAQTLFTKEPGTIRWLARVTPGDVVYDIGANIGCYTLLAAQRVGDAGHVYAFEPHAANAAHLLRNLHQNHLQRRVTLLTCALSDRVGYGTFRYGSKRPGSSGSQFGEMAQAAAQELKHVTTIDHLIAEREIMPAAFVKIDIDGHELAVLRGMGHLLAAGVRSIQTEVSPGARGDISAYFAKAGYRLADRHRTANGEQQVAGGADPDDVTDNAVFVRAA